MTDMQVERQNGQKISTAQLNGEIIHNDLVRACTHCGTLAYDEDNYCARCGHGLDKFCASCRSPISHPVAYYCTNCGSQLRQA